MGADIPFPRVFWERIGEQTEADLNMCFWETYLIPHVGLELKFEGRTEDLVAHVHDCMLVTSGIQVVYRVFNDIQPFVARGLQVVLG